MARSRSIYSFVHDGEFHNANERIKALRKSKIGIQKILVEDDSDSVNNLLKDASNVITVQNFPKEYTLDNLKKIFRFSQGFKDVRLVSEKNLGFVEFNDKVEAIIAVKKYEGFMIDEHHLLKVGFTKP